jgi:hypothetical protein
VIELRLDPVNVHVDGRDPLSERRETLRDIGHPVKPASVVGHPLLEGGNVPLQGSESRLDAVWHGNLQRGT